MKEKVYMQKFKGLKVFFLLWSTQALSSLSSSMTSYALIIWSYQQSGSALMTGLLTVSYYAPYVFISFFAGTLSDRWNKKRTMLVADSLAALGTFISLALLLTGNLKIWQLYPINMWNGFVGAFQQPASEVAISLITPKDKYQQTSGLRSFSNALITLLTPVFATMLLTFLGLKSVMLLDLATFAFAFVTLAFFIKIPQIVLDKEAPLFSALKQGIDYLRTNRGILDLILFLAAINFIVSICDNTLPALILSKKVAGSRILGTFNACAGLASLVGSILVSLMPPAKNKIRVICGTLFISLALENFFLAFSENVIFWYVSAFFSWIVIPFMSANMEIILRTKIPLELQGRVFAARNTLQYFTIPLGYLVSGVLIDHVFEPFMVLQSSSSLLQQFFGEGKGAGSAMLMGMLWIMGMLVCLGFSKDRHLWALETENS